MINDLGAVDRSVGDVEFDGEGNDRARDDRAGSAVRLRDHDVLDEHLRIGADLRRILVGIKARQVLQEPCRIGINRGGVGDRDVLVDVAEVPSQLLAIDLCRRDVRAAILIRKADRQRVGHDDVGRRSGIDRDVERELDRIAGLDEVIFFAMALVDPDIDRDVRDRACNVGTLRNGEEQRRPFAAGDNLVLVSSVDALDRTVVIRQARVCPGLFTDLERPGLERHWAGAFVVRDIERLDRVVNEQVEQAWIVGRVENLDDLEITGIPGVRDRACCRLTVAEVQIVAILVGVEIVLVGRGVAVEVRLEDRVVASIHRELVRAIALEAGGRRAVVQPEHEVVATEVAAHDHLGDDERRRLVVIDDRAGDIVAQTDGNRRGRRHRRRPTVPSARRVAGRTAGLGQRVGVGLEAGATGDRGAARQIRR